MFTEALYKGAVAATNFIAQQAGQLKDISYEAACQFGQSLRIGESNYPYITRPIVAAISVLEQGSKSLVVSFCIDAALGFYRVKATFGLVKKACSYLKEGNYTEMV